MLWWSRNNIHLCDANTSLAGQIESNYDEITDSFDSMDLKSDLLRGKLSWLYVVAWWQSDSSRGLRIWFRATVCDSAARYYAYY